MMTSRASQEYILIQCQFLFFCLHVFQNFNLKMSSQLYMTRRIKGMVRRLFYLVVTKLKFVSIKIWS